MIAALAPRRMLLLLLVAWIVAPVVGEKCIVDLALLLDESGSIGRRDWIKVKDFASSFADLLDVSREGSHIAVMTYGDDAKIHIPFSNYRRPGYNLESVKQDIANIKQRGGLTYIDKALELANRAIFTESAGMRTDKKIKKVAVVMTDGFQTVSGDAIIPLEEAAFPLKQKGVTIYALGVGGDVGLLDLAKIVNKPLNLFSARRFEDMVKRAKDIAETECIRKYRRTRACPRSVTT